jgi:hypothetical protein
MNDNRLFTDEELKALGQRTADLLQASIENGDTEEAIKLARRMYNEFSAMHDLYRDWVTHLLTIIGKRFGDEALGEALEETVGGYTRRLSSRYEGKSVRRRIEILAAGLRGHLQPFDLEEDDEKITITPRPCGSGERLAKDGAYGPPCNFLKIKKPQPMTFGRSDFPVYCSHCYFQNILPTKPGGSPLFVTEPSPDLGDKPCHIHIYK